MADYFRSSGSNNYSNGRFGDKFQPSWDAVHGGTKGYPDGRSNSNFLDKGEKYGDHVRRSVVLSSSTEEPPKVREFIYTVQTVASAERRQGFPGGMFQHHNGYIRYENSNDTSRNGWKQNGIGHTTDAAAQEHLIMTCQSEQPGRNGWATPNSYGTPTISRATNDIGTAVNYIRESKGLPAATMAGPRGGSGINSTPAFSSSGVIDSKEAAKKYNGYFL